MRVLSIFPVLALSVLAYANISANAQPSEAPQNIIKVTAPAPASALTVAELFTSQGCSSCPPAERMFSKLSERDDLLTLEWHVDYWDRLVHHGSRWKDPYSDKIFTERQRAYNRSLRGKSAVYTLQAIVNGYFEGVGSRKTDVSDMIENVPALTVPVSIASDRITVGPSADAQDILFLRLLERHKTDVTGGENKGKELHGRNIVLEAVIIGQTGTGSTELELPAIKDGETCAVLVQTLDNDVGPIMGAAKCT